MDVTRFAMTNIIFERKRMPYTFTLYTFIFISHDYHFIRYYLFFVQKFRSEIVCTANSLKASRGGARQVHE